MEIICYIKKKEKNSIFQKEKNSSNVTLFTLSRRVKAGRKFARPQPLCRIFDRAFRPASPDKTVPAGTKILPASIFASAPFVIDIIVIFSINLVLPSTRYSSATRVSSSMNWGGGFPWGKGWREREREKGEELKGRERRREEKKLEKGLPRIPTFPRDEWKEGEREGCASGWKYIRKGKWETIVWTRARKNFCSTLASSARAVSIDICHSDPLSIYRGTIERLVILISG